MTISYKRLWHLLIDKDMNKSTLQKQAGISWTAISKLNKGENVSTEILLKICKFLECDITDIMEIIPDDKVDAKHMTTGATK